MTATCFLLMSVSIGDINMLADAQITGNIVREDNSYYVMDFSLEAKEKGLDKSFNQKKVNKKDCVRVKKYGD